MAGAVVEERVHAAACAGEDVAKPRRRRLARDGSGQVARSFLEEPAQGVRCDEPAIQERRNAGAQAPLSKLREDERDVVVLFRKAAADAQRLIERLVDESGDLGVVRQVESGIDVRFEREFAEQLETEGVDGRYRDVSEALLQIAPPRRVELGKTAGFLQPLDDALAHLGGGLAREGDGEDVLRFDAGAQQVDVALHEHARLAGAGRCLEDDVLRGIDGVSPRVARPGGPAEAGHYRDHAATPRQWFRYVSAGVRL